MDQNPTAESPSVPLSASEPDASIRADTIRRQMEFWFSPSNLKRDWYLRRLMDEDGWLDPTVFLKFNRLKQLEASLEEVVEACKLSDVLEVSVLPADGESIDENATQVRVRRSPEHPAFTAEEAAAESERSLIVENIQNIDSPDALRNAFSRYGDVTYSWISRSKESPSYGIVSYKDAESSMAALDLYNEAPLTDLGDISVSAKVVWDARRSRKRSNSAVIAIEGLSKFCSWRDVWNEVSVLYKSIGVNLEYFMYRNGDPACYTTVSGLEQANAVINELFQNGRMLSGCSVLARVLTEKDELEKYWDLASTHILERQRKKKERTKVQPGQEMPHPQGVVVFVSGLPPRVEWRDLMGQFRQLGDVVFLTYKGGPDCYVRFADSDMAMRAVACLTGDEPAPLCGATVDALVLEGEDERQYWKEAAESRRMRRTNRSEMGSMESNDSEGNSFRQAQEEPFAV